MKAIFPSISTLHTVFALCLVSLAVPLHFTNHWTSTIWSLEIPLLAWVGVKHRLPAYSRFANALALYTFFGLIGFEIWQTSPVYAPLQIEHGKFMGAIGTVAYLAAFACHRWIQQANSKSSRAYFLMAACVATCTTLYFGSGQASQWIPLMFVAGGGLVAYLGFNIRDLFTRRLGEIGMFFGSLPLIFDHVNLLPALVTIWSLILADRAYKPYETSKVSTVRVAMNFGSLFYLGIVSEKFIGSNGVVAAWTVFAAALLCCGFSLKDAAMRRASIILAVLSGAIFNTAAQYDPAMTLIGLSWRDLTAALLCGASTLSACLYYQQRNRALVGKNWNSAFILSVTFGYAILLRLFSVLFAHQYLPLAYVAAAAIPLAVGILTSQKALRIIGWTTGLALPLLALGLNVSQWHTKATLLLSLALYGYGFVFKQMRVAGAKTEKSESQLPATSSFLLRQLSQEMSPVERDLEHVFSFIATAIMALIIGQHGRDFLSLLWALQGLTLLAVGFTIRDKFFRVYGLALLSLVSAKLVFVDTATLEITYRIMSFIAVGLVLLVTSFFYLRFSGRTKDADAESKLNSQAIAQGDAESATAEAA